MATAPGDDHDAVLATVRAYFSGQDSTDELIGGKLRRWVELAGQASWHAKFEFNRTLDHAELVELEPARAVVDVRAGFEAVTKRGNFEVRRRSDGPVVLEKLDGDWRTVDLVADGRRRSESIVLGVLAEQEVPGAVVRIVGLDRMTHGTSFVVELNDLGAGPLRVRQAYFLVEADTLWSRLSVSEHEPSTAGGSRRVLLHSNHAIDLEETVLAIALDVRAG